MTDYEIAVSIAAMFRQYGIISTISERQGRDILKECVILYYDNKIELKDKKLVSSYVLKKINAVAVEIPELSPNDDTAIAQLALAVGRRLERFERGAKANATRTPNSRKKIAQNAIQKRWSA